MSLPLRSLGWREVRVPLRTKVRHASHERTSSDNLIVAVTLRDGIQGFGEGIPRPYVTGETIDSSFATLERLARSGAIGSGAEPPDWPEAIRAVASIPLEPDGPDPRGMATNAVRCAFELALLDAFGKRFHQPLSAALEHLPRTASELGPPTTVRYSGAITAGSVRRERIAAIKQRIWGFRHIKVKVGVPGQDDPARLRRLRRILGRRVDLRLDANEAWPPEELLARVGPLRSARPSCLEQPVPHARIGELAGVRSELGLPLMLDESLCSLVDAEEAIAGGWGDLFNVRLSKCGGLVRSFALLDRAASAGLGAQLGCHPGETGLLSAAGRHVACRVRGLRFVEGSYDRHVLAANVIREEITFGYGGKARPLTSPGLGVTVDPEALDRLTVRRGGADFG